MFDPCLPDLALPAWRAVRASALDAVQQAARVGHVSMRVQGVHLTAKRLCRESSELAASVAGRPLPAFVQLSVRRGTAPAEVVFVFAAGGTKALDQ
ncbi:hypothetical protein [Ideonella sp. YS5]|uniref:hypothetical protein n=1 Tax=Ideonella sp. YS5 TaxID=3453714 RepID=UPI003EEA5BB2